MLLDLLKITNKVILSTIEDNVKPIMNVWFKDKKVIEESEPDWDGVTFHDIDDYKQKKQSGLVKVVNTIQPFLIIQSIYDISISNIINCTRNFWSSRLL